MHAFGRSKKGIVSSALILAQMLLTACGAEQKASPRPPSPSDQLTPKGAAAFDFTCPTTTTRRGSMSTKPPADLDWFWATTKSDHSGKSLRYGFSTTNSTTFVYAIVGFECNGLVSNQDFLLQVEAATMVPATALYALMIAPEFVPDSADISHTTDWRNQFADLAFEFAGYINGDPQDVLNLADAMNHLALAHGLTDQQAAEIVGEFLFVSQSEEFTRPVVQIPSPTDAPTVTATLGHFGI